MPRQNALDVAHGYDFEHFSLPDEKIPRHGYAPTYSALPYGIETYLNPLITPHSYLLAPHCHSPFTVLKHLTAKLLQNSVYCMQPITVYGIETKLPSTSKDRVGLLHAAYYRLRY